MTEMLVGLVLIIFTFSISTLASVLLVAFAMPNALLWVRILAAAGGTGVMLTLSALAMAAIDQPVGLIELLIGLVLIGIIAFAVIGLPIAYFATKRLDKMTKIEWETFE